MNFEDKEFDKWREVNSRDQFTYYDYLYGMFVQNNIPKNLLVGMQEIFWPTFIEKGNCIFLKGNFSERKYLDNLSKNLSLRDLEYWMNLISFDGFFFTDDGLEFDENKITQFITGIAEAWNCKIKYEYPDKQYYVEVISDVDSDDFCVTFYRN